MDKITVASFYQFVPLPDFRTLQNPLLQVCLDNELKGTILLAGEGINGTLSGLQAGIDAVLVFLKQDSRFKDLIYKVSNTHSFPFKRMKVRLKKEIVSMGKLDIDPNRKVGAYVKPEDWNSLICDPEVLLLDTRNDYEIGIGSFKGAINPKTDSFREFPEYVGKALDSANHKKVAMFCTGGIRCEKATSYLLDQGFENVYHLQGGILKYLEQIPARRSLWEGECFVFDDRVTLDHSLNPGSYRQCYACRRPLSQQDLLSAHYAEGLSCSHCFDSLSDNQRSRFAERQKQIGLSQKRKASNVS